jgi:hypothetical protein
MVAELRTKLSKAWRPDGDKEKGKDRDKLASEEAVQLDMYRRMLRCSVCNVRWGSCMHHCVAAFVP